MPEPHRGILSFAASGGILRYRLDAIHSGGRVRAFSSETDRTPIPAIARSGVADPGAASDVVAYRLTVTGERGVTVERTLPFRYRRAVLSSCRRQPTSAPRAAGTTSRAMKPPRAWPMSIR
jgi:hypothetical protein